MKAAVIYGENDIRMTEVETPRPAPGQVVVKVLGSGVCATDVKILGGNGLPKELPTILGHEVAGTVEELGQGVTGYKIGQRVAVYPIAACGECFYCRQGRHSLCLEQYGFGHGIDGGFAEYVLVPERIVNLGGIQGIGEMPFDLAAMVEPVSCCLAAARQCGTAKGNNVVIVGCGPLGLFHTIVSKALGARVIAVDVNTQRLSMAKKLGAETVLNPQEIDINEEIKKLTGIGADIVIAALGATHIIEGSLPLVRNGGVFNIFGGTPAGETITLDPRWLHYGEVVITGTFAASLDDFKASLDFVRENAGLVSSVISVRCGLDDILTAVESVKNGTALKTVILFN